MFVWNFGLVSNVERTEFVLCFDDVSESAGCIRMHQDASMRQDLGLGFCHAFATRWRLNQHGKSLVCHSHSDQTNRETAPALEVAKPTLQVTLWCDSFVGGSVTCR